MTFYFENIGHSATIQDILREYRTFCENTGHFARIQDILRVYRTFCENTGHFARMLDFIVMFWREPIHTQALGCDYIVVTSYGLLSGSIEGAHGEGFSSCVRSRRLN